MLWLSFDASRLAVLGEAIYNGTHTLYTEVHYFHYVGGDHLRLSHVLNFLLRLLYCSTANTSFDLTYTGSSVRKRQRTATFTGCPAQRACARIRLPINCANGRTGHVTRTATHAVRAQFRIQHASLVATAANEIAAAFCEKRI